MASVNKKFAVEKGLEVGDQALVVDADNNRTGIGKTNPEYGLDVATTARFDGIVAAAQVGIGSTQPARDGDFNADIAVRKKLYDMNDSAGSDFKVLVSVGTGVSWSSNADITALADGRPDQLQYKKDDGTFGGASQFVYDDGNDRVGIGSTQPDYTLDVDGTVRIDGVFYDSNSQVGVAKSILAADNAGKLQWVGAGASTLNIIYVAEDGNDTNSGRTLSSAKRSIKAATEIASAGDVIRVAGGVYSENNPITVPRNVSIDGDDLRNTQVIPSNVGQDLFKVHNGALIQNMSFVGAANTGAMITFPPEGVVNRHSFVSANADSFKIGPNWHTGVSTTPTLINYDPISGVTTATIVGHGLTLSDSIGIVTGGFAMTCDSDDNATLHSYPRASDPLAGIFTGITSFTSDTITFLSGDAGSGARITGIITQSPYVRNCTNFVPNSIGMRINGNHSGGTKSMVVDSYTQYNQGGIGVTISNDGYAQLVSIFTVCDEYAISCVSGGQCDLNNSNASFGTFGIVASGVGTVTDTGALAVAAVEEDNTVVISGLTARPYSGQVFYLGELFNEVIKVNITNAGTGYTSTNPPTVSIAAPTGPNGANAEATATVNGFGQVTSIDMFATGTQYRTAPAITISSGSGTTAEATAEVGPTYFTINTATPVTAGVSTVTIDQKLPASVGIGSAVPIQRQSLILASSYTFEFVGAGLTIANALPRKGGVTIPENETVSEGGGRVVYTSTDERGNLKVGDGFTINQQTGTITGDAFNKSIQATLTPLIIALGGNV
jgi:hypothetical protein